MKLKSTLLLAASLLGAASAQATVYDFGTHDTFELSALAGPSAGGVGVGAFLDFYTFEIAGSPQVVSSSVVALNNASVLTIAGGQYAVLSFGANGVFDSGGGDDQLALGSPYSFDGTSGNTTHAITLDAGKYYYAVIGTGTGSVGGYYTLSSTVAPVPEPHSYLLMLAGLGAVGFVASRRQAR